MHKSRAIHSAYTHGDLDALKTLLGNCHRKTSTSLISLLMVKFWTYNVERLTMIQQGPLIQMTLHNLIYTSQIRTPVPGLGKLN
jgi:hypothetical protein